MPMVIPDPEQGVWVLGEGEDARGFARLVSRGGGQEDAFYVCQLADLARKHRLWTAALPHVHPHYAVKCNDSMIVLETLAALGVSFDCASKSEMDKVLSLGVKPERIVFANSIKPEGHIRHAAKIGVNLMTFDNPHELQKIKNLHPKSKLLVRIKSDAADAQCLFGRKFGCGAGAGARRLLGAAAALGLDVVGVSFHVGSGCHEPAAYARAVAAARRVFDAARAAGFRFRLLDIGGGFPGDYGPGFPQIAECIRGALARHFPEASGVRVIAEPGRFFVHTAFALACRIHCVRDTADDEDDDEDGDEDGAEERQQQAAEKKEEEQAAKKEAKVKEEDDKAAEKGHEGTEEPRRLYYINDGVFGSFSAVVSYREQFTAAPLEERAGAGPPEPCRIWGPTCDGVDLVAERALLPPMRAGDWLWYEEMGAYTLCLATAFNGFPAPPVFVVADDPTRILLKNKGCLLKRVFHTTSDLHSSTQQSSWMDSLINPLIKSIKNVLRLR